MLRVIKLFGVGVTLVVLALAAGSYSQVHAQQIGIGGLLGFYWEGTRSIYYAANVGSNIPSVFVEVNTGEYSGSAQVQYWDGSLPNPWKDLGAAIGASSGWVRLPATGGISTLEIRIVGNKSYGRFRIGVDTWPGRPNTDNAYQFRLSNDDRCRSYSLGRDDDRPNLAFLVGVRHSGLEGGTITLPGGVKVPKGQGYIVAAPAPVSIIVCADKKHQIVGEIVLKPYWSNP